MIRSKKDYLDYLEADRLALGVNISGLMAQLKELVFPNVIWDFQKKLRRLEYYRNCKKGFVSKIIYCLKKNKFQKISIKLGFTIPENTFGSGLAIVHYGTIVVNGRAKVGRNCRIHACVNIGASGGEPEAPQIGDNVYIGPGAKIFGDVKIANNVAISANSTVNKSFSESDILIAGSPARKIKEFDVTRIIKHLKTADEKKAKGNVES